MFHHQARDFVQWWKSKGNLSGDVDLFPHISLSDFMMHYLSRYFDEHPEYKEQGLSLSKFSFQIPRPLQENYVRKRPVRAAPTSDADDIGIPRSPFPSKGDFKLYFNFYRHHSSELLH